jgi:hypothetical protein
VKRAVKALEGIPTSTLESLREEDEELIRGVRDIAARRLEIAEQIRQ